jgi:hypothetical protein
MHQFRDIADTSTPARLAGIEKDLGLTSLQFNTASMVFFVGYVAFEIPSNLVLKKVCALARWRMRNVNRH